MRKATVDMRLAKRKAKADHRRAQSDRQLSHSQASTSSSAAEFLTSSAQPLKHDSTAATATGSSKRSVKSKATKASLATTAPSSAPVEGLRSRAQRRATTRSGRNAAWGMEAVGQASSQGGHVVNARLGNVVRAEAGLGTAVGGLFKVCCLTRLSSCACCCETLVSQLVGGCWSFCAQHFNALYFEHKPGQSKASIIWHLHCNTYFICHFNTVGWADSGACSCCRSAPIC